MRGRVMMGKADEELGGERGGVVRAEVRSGVCEWGGEISGRSGLGWCWGTECESEGDGCRGTTTTNAVRSQYRLFAQRKTSQSYSLKF